MHIIQNNPYRTVGLLVGATAREQDRQIRRLKQFIAAGQDPDEGFSFPVLGTSNRTEDSVNEAASKLNLDSDKINAALFWFWNGNPITDEAAFDALKDGDIEAAYQIWDKLTTETTDDGKRIWKNINEKNCSAFHNSSVLALITNKGAFVSTVVANIKFIESDYFEKFVKDVVDETYRVSKRDIQIAFLKPIFDTIDSRKVAGLVNYLNEYNFSAKADFQKIFVQKPIEQIEQKIETAKSKRKASKANAAKAGQELFASTTNDLIQLKSIISTNDIKYASIADKLADEILQCSIDYFNENWEKESNNNYFEPAIKLAKQAEAIAVGKLAKDRVKDSINTLEEMKTREISEAIHLLQSIKDAYEENKRKIKQQVKEIEETDFEIKLGYKSINHSAVEDSIKNAIDWQKVNELLVTVLSDNNLKKIKENDKTEAKNEFWELVNWIKENSLKTSTISVIIDKYKSIPPKLCFEVLSAEVTNTDNKPFYVEDIRYIGIRLKIKSFGKQEVTIYKKYINPEGKYKNNSKSSPVGYTTLDKITITPETKTIDLGSWGNEKECTYEVGEHKIEIYVEHYKVYTKTFQVDWSPKKKPELTKNLELLQNELREVEKFKWFRAAENKQKEVKEIQDKIKKANQILMNI